MGVKKRIMSDKTVKPVIKGQLIDSEIRCVHYHSQLDIIAIKFKCCGDYYPCYQCHEQAVEHSAQVWAKEEFNELAILCGACNTEITINEYLKSNSKCPFCAAYFNPKCSNHYHLYFNTEG